MKYFALYDSDGNILGRLKVSSARNAAHYQAICIELTPEEFDATEPIEHTHKVDIAQKKLKTKE